MRIKLPWWAAFTAAGLVVLPCVVVSRSLGTEATRKNPVPPDDRSLAAGKELYGAHCADCHGPLGKGDGKRAADLPKSPPDLTDPDLAAEPDDALFRMVSRGRKPMPRFDKLLSEEQRWHVVNYVRTLAKAK